MLYYPIEEQKYLAVTPIVDDYPVSNGALIALNSVLDAPKDEDNTFSTTSLIKAIWGDSDGEKMIKILTCESGLREDDDSGKPLMSSTSDEGIAQINQIWWNKAKELGNDLATTIGNLNMAKYIWDQSGFNAWTCTKLVIW